MRYNIDVLKRGQKGNDNMKLTMTDYANLIKTYAEDIAIAAKNMHDCKGFNADDLYDDVATDIKRLQDLLEKWDKAQQEFEDSEG